MVGAFTSGIVPLFLGRVHELLRHHPDSHRCAWSKAITNFAIAQAFAAYGMSFLFDRFGGGYRLVSVLGSCALVLALIVDLVAGVIGDRS